MLQRRGPRQASDISFEYSGRCIRSSKVHDQSQDWTFIIKVLSGLCNSKAAVYEEPTSDQHWRSTVFTGPRLYISPAIFSHSSREA